jgi:hypothetical protein
MNPAVEPVIKIRPALRRRMSFPILWIKYVVPTMFVSITRRAFA